MTLYKIDAKELLYSFIVCRAGIPLLKKIIILSNVYCRHVSCVKGIRNNNNSQKSNDFSYSFHFKFTSYMRKYEYYQKEMSYKDYRNKIYYRKLQKEKII